MPYNGYCCNTDTEHTETTICGKMVLPIKLTKNVLQNEQTCCMIQSVQFYLLQTVI